MEIVLLSKYQKTYWKCITYFEFQTDFSKDGMGPFPNLNKCHSEVSSNISVSMCAKHITDSPKHTDIIKFISIVG